MKTIILAATAALGLWGCAHSSTAGMDSAQAAQGPRTEKDIAQESRQGAPTVYDGEAVGGAGNSVTTSEGETWAPEAAPGNTTVRTPSDTQRSLERDDGQKGEQRSRSQVIDEGKTDDASGK